MNPEKVLIISGLPFRNDTNLGKTLCTLFSAFSQEELAQLYFSPQVPNVKACSSFFQLNEKQLINSLLGVVDNKCGKVISPDDIIEDYKMVDTNPRALLALRKNIVIPILRDCLWSLSRWKNAKLRRWLNDIHPNVIFCILPGSIKSCTIIEYVAEKYHCPVVLFVTDDYYNITETNPSRLRRWYYHRLQESIDKMAKHVCYVIGCSEIAAEEFGKMYNVPFEAIFTPSAHEYLSLAIHEQTDKRPIVFRYFGNLGLERWKPLVELGKAIAAYNDGEQKAILEVYSNMTYPDAIAKLDVTNGCQFKGWVHGEDYLRLLQDADVAVHVESFSEAMCRRTRLSVSTKIADYLGAGKCILAIGRGDLASIQHISDVAVTVNDTSELDNIVAVLIESPHLRSRISQKAREFSKSQHDIKTIEARVKAILQQYQTK